MRHEGHFPDGLSAPPDVLEGKAAFQVAPLLLLRLPPRLSAACRLGVRIPGEESLLGGAMVEVGGDSALAGLLIVALHEALFGRIEKFP